MKKANTTNTKNTKASANTSARKVKGDTMKNTSLEARFKNAKFTETKTLKTKANKVNMNKHLRFANLTTDNLQAIYDFGFNEFETLQKIFENYTKEQGVTMTKKNIRVKVNATDFIYIWRRAVGVRVYTNNPKCFVGIAWVKYENENEPYTHVANCSDVAVIEAIKKSETIKA